MGTAADVIIVGAGPVGLTLALELAQRDVQALVLDAKPAYVAEGSKAMVLARHAFEILADVGCSRLVQKAVALERARTYFRDVELFAIDFPPHRAGDCVSRVPIRFGVELTEKAFRQRQYLKARCCDLCHNRCRIACMPQVADDLKRVPLFSGLSKRQLGRLAGSCRERIIGAGLTPVREGKKSGVSFFVIADGEAVVTIGGKQVATLGPGDHFGELALISKRERNATVTATTRLRCLTMNFWDFREFARQNPDVTWKLLQHVVDLLAAEREA